MAQRLTTNAPAGNAAPQLWLAADNGVRLASPRREPITPIEGPEAEMEVEFVGLTPEQQQRAITGFPGGTRFRLKQ